MTLNFVSAIRRGRAVDRAFRPVIFAFSGAAMMLGAGCSTSSLPRITLRKPPAASSSYAPGNHAGVPAIPATVRRVAVLPLDAAGWRDSELAPLDEAFLTACGRVERFETVRVSREELAARFGQESFASTGALPANLLSRLAADYGVDAVLLLDLTHFTPYEPVSLGVRAKLVTVDSGDVLWSFDSIFDAARPDVSLAARQFSTGRKRPPAAVEDDSGILQSPSRFAGYVGHAMFETFPPRRTE